jgi:hypothetical protein
MGVGDEKKIQALLCDFKFQFIASSLDYRQHNLFWQIYIIDM